MADEHQDEKSLFLAALEIDSDAERAAFLKKACEGNPQLQAEVDALLQAHAKSQPILDAAPSPDPDIDQPITDHSGSVVGPYKLIEQIGEGGMGTVWMAQQTAPVKRVVALKLIKAGMDSKQVIARFEAERQALALMDHANICRVLDAGATSAGRPYFVMDLVKGVPITRYCDEHHLTPRQRLELFLPVCQAVQHAHQKGVIHRDLKPSNVLVALYDGKPVPKVIDFGVAKATEQNLTDKTLVTGFGAIVGTLEYMSPEQAEINQLDIDTRSDIYSLGVLLYELLAGSPPFSRKDLEKAGMLEMLRVIREQEPAKPSTKLSTADGLPSLAANRGTEPAKLARLVRGELDWIVMKALEKDRNRRYETANGFAMDVQRYLADEPVSAGPPSAWYRVRKFARRNKGAVLAAAAFLFVLAAGIAGTTFGLLRAEHRRAQAEQAEDDTLAEFRASADDAIEQLIGSKPTLGPQERTYLEKTLKRWQAFAARQGDDERSKAIRAEGHHRVGYLWQKLGRPDDARAEYETARDLQKQLVAAFPAVFRYRQGLASTQNNLGLLLVALSQHDAARTEYASAIDLHQNVANVPELQEVLATTHNNLGLLEAGLGRHEAARKEYEAARDIQKQLATRFADVPEFRQQLAQTRSNLANLLVALSQRDAAREEYESARGMQKQLVADFPAAPKYQNELATTHNCFGMFLAALGERDEARKEYESARDLQKKLLAAFPAVPEFQGDLAGTHYSLGIHWLEAGQFDAARTEYEASRDLRKKLVEAYPAMADYQWELAVTHNGLAILFASQGQYDAARTAFDTARDLHKKLVAAHPTVPQYQQELAATHNNLGKVLAIQGKNDAARTELEAAHKLHEKLVESFPAVAQYKIHLGISQNNFGAFLRERGNPAESLPWFDAAIRTYTPVYEQDRRQVNARQFLCNAHSNRAEAFDLLKKHAEALRDWDKAVELGPDAEQSSYRAGRAKSRVKVGQTSEAVAEVEELAKASKSSAEELYSFACVFAVASTKVAEKKQAYADRAMDLLRQAVQAGYKDAANLAKDPDLDSLCQREAFKKLLGELKSEKK